MSRSPRRLVRTLNILLKGNDEGSVRATIVILWVVSAKSDFFEGQNVVLLHLPVKR